MYLLLVPGWQLHFLSSGLLVLQGQGQPKAVQDFPKP